MKISVDISLYPLTAEFTKPIDRFIKSLYKYEGIRVKTHHLSTMIIGEYDEVMAALNKEMKAIFTEDQVSCFVMKVLNGDAEEKVDLDGYR